jgi:type IV pilus assembly protein PilM
MDEQPSIWKKEVSFRRKQEPRVEGETAAGPGATEERKSIWKREVSFRRTREPDAEREPGADPAPPADDETPTSTPAVDEETAIPAATTDVSFPTAANEVTAPTAEPAIPGLSPELLAAFARVDAFLASVQPGAETHAEETEGDRPTEIVAVPDAVSSQSPVAGPAAAPGPEATAAPAPTPQTDEAPRPSETVEEPATPPAEPVVVRPPVPAAALPPLPREWPWRRQKKKEKEEKAKAEGEAAGAFARLFSRDLALGRKPAAGDATEEKETPKGAPARIGLLGRELRLGRKRSAVDATEETKEKEKSEQAARVPFSRRELPFGRKQSGGEAEEEGTKEKEKAAAGVPFYRRELTFGRKRSGPGGAEEAEEREKKEKSENAAAGIPFYRRELAFGRKRSGPSGAEEAEAREKKEKSEKAGVPFYRRELTFGRKPKPAAADAPEIARSAGGSPAKLVAAKLAALRSLSLSLPRPQPRGARASGKAQKRVVGLKVGASQLAAATVVNNGHPEVVQVARVPLPPGIVSGGELRDPEALAEALRAFFAENKLPKRGVRLGIATNRIGVRTLEIAGIEDPKQLANAIRFRAQEALPIPIDEAVLDYQVVEETTNEDGERLRRILLVLAYRDLVDRYVAACRKAGISLVGIDLEAFALLRALAAPRDADTHANAALVAVTVGHDRTTFAVSDGRVCEFTRVLDWGGATLNVALARALNRAPSEVDDVKHALSLDANETPADLTPEEAQAGRDALRRQVQTFARELVSSLQFYQNQPGSLGIGEIVITGGTAHLPGFAAELERLIGVRVRVGDPLVRVKVGKRFEEPTQLGSLAVAIGLGIED